jgi:class 3 adenylate cyclase
MRIKSLNRRLTLLTVLPVGAFLLFAGLLGFFSAKEIMLDQWREGAIAQLQRAAHQIDMRLRGPIDWIEMFHTASTERGGRLIQEWIIERIRELDGVEAVTLKWSEDQGSQAFPSPMGSRMGGMGRNALSAAPGEMMRPNRGKILEVTPPRYNAERGRETVDLVSELKDESGKIIGKLTVSIRFDSLMQGMTSLGWWQSDMACLVDYEGNYLAHTASYMKKRTRLGEDGNEFEVKILRDILANPSGTVMGPGYPPGEVAGFYRIELAPWAIVLMAPGETILAPIIRYRNYYLAGAGICIVVVILIVRLDTGKTIRSISAITQAARRISQGDYASSPMVHRSDEIGELAESFQSMVEGLKERDFIANTFGRYVDREIASELLKRPEASRLGGQKRSVAIVMSDIRGFAALSETLSPERIISFLNRYFSNMIAIVQSHGGIIVDFFGDSILIFFDPFEGPLESSIQKSLQCAQEMRDAMGHLNQSLKAEGFPELKMGIGIHAGEVVVGNIGSETRAKYGIVGSPVNLTQRIQSVAGPGEIVVSEAVLANAGRPLQTGRRLTADLKGFKEEVPLYVLA